MNKNTPLNAVTTFWFVVLPFLMSTNDCNANHEENHQYSQDACHNCFSQRRHSGTQIFKIHLKVFMRTHKDVKMEMFFNQSTAVELVLLTVPVFILDRQL